MEMQAAASNLVATEEKRRLIDTLTILETHLYDLEQNKRDLLLVVRHEGNDISKLQEGFKDINPNLERVKNDIKAAGLLLRQQFKQGGNEVDDQLEKAIYERKEWIETYQDIFAKEGAGGIAKRLDASIQALKDAGNALIKLIDALKTDSRQAT